MDVSGDIEDWLSLLDQVLHGLHHALNNRIGTLSALVELAQLQELPPDGTAIKSVAADLERLADCNRVVQLLRRDRAAGEEALLLDDVITDAYAVHRFLHDVRDVQVTASPRSGIEPVRVERWVALRALVLLLYDARRLAKRLATIVRTVAESDEDWVRIEFRLGESEAVAIAEVPQSPGGRYAERLAASCGGEVVRAPGTVGMRLPTLKARRGREAASRG